MQELESVAALSKFDWSSRAAPVPRAPPPRWAGKVARRYSQPVRPAPEPRSGVTTRIHAVHGFEHGHARRARAVWPRTRSPPTWRHARSRANSDCARAGAAATARLPHRPVCCPARAPRRVARRPLRSQEPLVGSVAESTAWPAAVAFPPGGPIRSRAGAGATRQSPRSRPAPPRESREQGASTVEVSDRKTDTPWPRDHRGRRAPGANPSTDAAPDAPLRQRNARWCYPRLSPPI